MKLIKLEDKFILVSDETIKEGDFVLAKDTNTIFQCNEHEASKPIKQFKELYCKIISENPDFSLLSEADCLKIGYVDVEKLAELYVWGGIYLNEQEKQQTEIAYMEGFKTAQSLNDKMFSLEYMSKAINLAYVSGGSGDSYQECEKFVEEQLSLQQTSWDVEVEMEEYVEEETGHELKWMNKRPKIINNSIKLIKLL